MIKRYTAFLLLIAVAIPAIFFSPDKVNATTFTIQVADNFFNPASQNATVGDTIFFQWVGPTRSHTATCNPGVDPSTSLPGGAATFNQPINSGSQTYSYVLTVAGTYNYNCQFHAPSMAGTLNVSAGVVTYAWNRIDSSDFQVTTNWTPTRTTPAATDILQFNNGAANTIAYNVPTQTLGGIAITGNTSIKFYNTFSGTNNTLTVGGGTNANPAFQIGAGSTLTFSATTATNILICNLPTGATGLIGGTFNATSTVTATGHKFQAIDANAVTFQNGAVFNYGPFAGGNVFGAGTGVSGLNSMIFQSGSRFVFKSIANGANPFGATAPSSVCVFQTGSTFEHQSSLSPVASGRTYANFEMNLAGGNASVTGGSAFTLDNLTVTDGTFNCNVTGRINIKGNISVASGKTLTFTPASGPVDSLLFNGTTQQSISGAGTLTLSSAFPHKVVMNNSNGLVLNKNVVLPGSLIMLSGNITTGANTLTLGASTSVLGTMVNAAGIIIGNFERWYAASTTAAPLLYPMGTATFYRPVTIAFPTTAPTTGGTIIVSHTDGTDGSDLAIPINDGGFNLSRRSNMYWNLTAANGLLGGVYDLTADGNGQNGINSSTNLRLIYSGDGGTTFSAPGTHASGTGTVANRTGIAGGTYGRHYLGGNSINNPLPVELDNFVATTIKNEVILDWATGHEQNNTGFEVQRAALITNQNSTDNVSTANYETVGYVQSKGNSNLVQSYSFNDKNLQAGRYVYRLKQIDVNGNHTYFLLNNEVFVNLPGKFFISQNYPNPFNPTTSINYEMPFDGLVKIVVYDNIGREVKTLVNGNVNAGYYKAEFNASSLPSGIYFYRVNAVSGSQSFEKVYKMMLIK